MRMSLVVVALLLSSCAVAVGPGFACVNFNAEREIAISGSEVGDSPSKKEKSE